MPDRLTTTAKTPEERGMWKVVYKAHGKLFKITPESLQSKFGQTLNKSKLESTADGLSFAPLEPRKDSYLHQDACVWSYSQNLSNYGMSGAGTRASRRDPRTEERKAGETAAKVINLFGRSTMKGNKKAFEEFLKERALEVR